MGSGEGLAFTGKPCRGKPRPDIQAEPAGKFNLLENPGDQDM